jgi:hypothetical protein
VSHFVMLVTPDGEWVAPDSADFLAALGDPEPDYDAVAFAVTNLGFVKFQVIQRSIVEIELHPRNVELPALLAVQQQLVTSEVRLFRVKYVEGGGWKSEITSSAEAMIARLSELCAPVLAPPQTERFSVEPQDLSTLFTDEENAFRPLAQKWRVSFAQFDPTVISVAVTHGLLPRLMIAGIKPNSEPIWRFIGNGHGWIGSRYQVHGVGDRVESMPDKDYGSWATEYYKSVAATGQPRYDRIVGTIQYEEEAGRPRRAISYERVMLPWRTSSREVLVTMCSRLSGASTSAQSITAPRSIKLATSA